MNRKRIEKVLTKKHEEFVATIKDEKVRKLVDKNSIITGGAIVSLYQGERVNDFDYYFTDKETCLEVAKYFVAEFIKKNPRKLIPMVTETGDRIAIKVQSAGIVGEADTSGSYEYFESREQSEGTDYLEEVTSNLDNDVPEEEVPTNDAERSRKPYNVSETNVNVLERPTAPKDHYRAVFMSSNAITLSDDIQLVIRFYGDPKEIHENYDFTHTTNFWLSSDKKVHVNQDALECILTKELKYEGSKYPLASVIRTRKFIQRGWKINAGQYLKMCFQVSKLNLDNIEVLRDQLVGVDSAYFTEVINAIQTEREKNSEWKLDETYLATLIDKIF